MKKINRIKRLMLLLILLVIAGGGWAYFSGGGSDAPKYRTDTVTKGNISQVVTASGTLNPVELITIGSQVSGKIDNIYVKVNDTVKKDQVLADVDPAIPASQLKQSKANLETARTSFELAGRNLKRTRTLVEKDYVPKVDLENAEQAYLSARNGYESAKTQVERDEVNLSYTKITSPIDGVIVSQEVNAGQTLASNFQSPNLFKIAGDLTKMKIDVNFSEADISKVKVAMPVTFTVDAFPDREFKGIVQTVNLNPNTEQGVVTFTVVVIVDNPDKVLLPGLTAYVTIILSEEKDVLRVPASALRFTPPVEQAGGISRLFQPGGFRPPRPPNLSRRMLDNDPSAEITDTIYLLKDDKLTPVEVKIGSTDESFVAVSGDNIHEGDTVVTGLAPNSKR